MGVNTSSGCKLSIGTTATTASSDNYKEIGFVANLGQFGRVYSEIKFDDLSNRNTLKFKGQRDDGQMTVDLGRDAADEGQAAAIVALDSDQDYNFKVELNDSPDDTGATNTIFYFKAKVMSYTTNISTPNNVVHSQMVVALQSGSIDETPAST